MERKLLGKNLGERLRELREERGWLQQDVAAKINMSQKNYSKYETGQIKNPTQETLKKLSDLYGIPETVLMRKYNAFEHIPLKILNMIQKEDSLPFLMEAFKKYEAYLEEKRTYED